MWQPSWRTRQACAPRWLAQPGPVLRGTRLLLAQPVACWRPARPAALYSFASGVINARPAPWGAPPCLPAFFLVPALFVMCVLFWGHAPRF